MSPARQGRLAGASLLAIALIWIVSSLVQLWTRRELMGTWSFPDPDDALRLVQVRDWLAGQSWFDVTQYRIGPPSGVLMHWSRLVDVPLYLAISVLTLAFSQPMAEQLAIIIVPLLTHLVFLAGVFWLTLNVTERQRIALVACLLSALALGISAQFRPMRIDHHAWQITLTVFAVALLFRTGNAARNAALAGLLMAATLAVSLEGLPIAMSLAGICTLRFLREQSRSRELAAFMAAVVGGSVAILSVTSKVQWLTAPHCDALSLVYMLPLAVFACGVFLLSRISRPMGFGTRLVSIMVISAAAIASGVAVGPECVQGPFAALHPLVRDLWYENVREGLPVWRQSTARIVLNLLPAAIGLAGAFAAYRSCEKDRKSVWMELMLLQVAAMAVAIMVSRAMAVSHALALPGNAWLLMAAFGWSLRMRRPVSRLVATSLCTLLIPHVAMFLVVLVISRVEKDNGEFTSKMSPCFSDDTVTKLNQVQPALLFSPIDVGPAILATTHHSVVATGHHRNQAGMLLVLSAFTSPPAEAAAIVRQTEARYLVYCRNVSEAKLYRKTYPNSLAAMLSHGGAPDWLVPVRTDLSGFSVFEIVRDGNP